MHTFIVEWQQNPNEYILINVKCLVNGNDLLANTHTHTNSNAISLLSSLFFVSVGFGSAEFICYCNLIPMPVAQAARTSRRKKSAKKIYKNYYKSTAQTINGSSITQRCSVSRRSLYLHCVNIHQTTKHLLIKRNALVRHRRWERIASSPTHLKNAE